MAPEAPEERVEATALFKFTDADSNQTYQEGHKLLLPRAKAAVWMLEGFCSTAATFTPEELSAAVRSVLARIDVRLAERGMSEEAFLRIPANRRMVDRMAQALGKEAR